MTKNEQYNPCRQQLIETITSQLSFTWLVPADPRNTLGCKPGSGCSAATPELFGGWGPCTGVGEGEETTGGLFLFLFFFFLPFSSSVFLHGLGRLPGLIFSSLKHFAEEG